MGDYLAGADGMTKDNSGTSLGFERELWQAADALRSNMDAAEYKHVVLGLIFLKYISDVFEEKHRDLAARQASDYTDPEDPDEYRAVNIFWWTRPWWPSSATTHRSRGCCPRTTPTRGWTSNGWAS